MLTAKLLIFALVPVAVTAILFYLMENTSLGQKTYKHQQIIIGVAFGVVAVIGNESGVDVQGVIINIRDAAPLCAGLIFGGPAGIIAGLIGGLERWLCVYWGGGMYSRESCAIATIMAGVIAAIIRKVFFDNKRATLLGGIVAAIVTEVIHHFLLFVFHLSDPEKVYDIITGSFFPMLFCTAFSVALAIMAVKLMKREKLWDREKTNTPVEKVRKNILLITAVVLAFSLAFTFALQTFYQKAESVDLLNNATNNVVSEIERNPDVDREALERVCKIEEISGIIITDDGKVLEDAGFDVKNNGDEEQCYSLEKDGKEYYWTYEKTGDEYVVALIDEAEVYKARNNEVYTNAFIIILVLCAVCLCMFMALKKILIRNLKETSDAFGKIIGTEEISEKEDNSMEEYSAFAGNVKKYMDDVRVKLDEEMETSRMIQISAMPAPFIPIPEITVNAYMEPARQVGGDFYDYFFIDNHKLGFLVADVSGKGISAAMFMMRAKGMLRHLALENRDLDEVFNIANRELCQGNEGKLFVTVWMGIIDINTGHVRFADAGHGYPLLKTPGGKFEYLQCQPELVLAGYENKKYMIQEFDMPPGSRLCIFTDGVIDANNAEGRRYGEDKLKDFVNGECSGFNGKNVIRAIKEDIDAFAGGAEQFDDITMLMVDYMGDMSHGICETRTFEAKLECLDSALDSWEIC